MHRLYDDIPSNKVTVVSDDQRPSGGDLAMYLAMAKCRVLGTTWRITLQNDIPRSSHAQTGSPTAGAEREARRTMTSSRAGTPKWNPGVDLGPHPRGGLDMVQELAFTLRDGMEYVEACIGWRLPVDDAAAELQLLHNEFFEEICKLRAARRIWARMMKDRYGAKSDARGS